jgi:hypothetical protein
VNQSSNGTSSLAVRTLRASVRHTDAFSNATRLIRVSCPKWVFRMQWRSRTDRRLAWLGIDSSDSSADRPPLTGPQRITIRRKAQESRDKTWTDG